MAPWITKDTPILGKWKQKVTKIDQFYLVDCVLNPFAVVTGAAVAFFHVFWSINGPECIDNAYDRLKARGKPPPNTPGTGRGKHRRFSWNGTAVGPSNAAPPGTWGNTLIPLGDAAQKVGFVLGIVDGFLNGIFYGGTLAYRYSGCRTPGSPYCQQSMTNQVPVLLGAGEGWLGQWVLDGRFVLLSSGTFVGIPPTVTPFITAMVSITQQNDVFPGLPDCTFSYEMRWHPSGDPVRQNYAGLGYTMDGSGVFFGKDILKHATDSELGIWINKTFGVLFVAQASWAVFAGSLTGNLSPHQCKADLGLIGGGGS